MIKLHKNISATKNTSKILDISVNAVSLWVRTIIVILQQKLIISNSAEKWTFGLKLKNL